MTGHQIAQVSQCLTYSKAVLGLFLIQVLLLASGSFYSTRVLSKLALADDVADPI